MCIKYASVKSRIYNLFLQGNSHHIVGERFSIAAKIKLEWMNLNRNIAKSNRDLKTFTFF